MSTAYAATGVGRVIRAHRARDPGAQVDIEFFCACNAMIRAARIHGPDSDQFKQACDHARPLYALFSRMKHGRPVMVSYRDSI